MNAFSILLSMFLLVVLVKVIYIQYVEGNRYLAVSDKNNFKEEEIEANRGNIYSLEGDLLATTISKYTIRMDAVTVDNTLFQNNVKALSDSLANMFGTSSIALEKRIRKAKKDKNRYLFIRKDVGYIDYLRIKQFPIFNKGAYKGGFIAKSTILREYPFGALARRTIGYENYRGKVGLEGAYSKDLKGNKGYRVVRKIAQGQWRLIDQGSEVQPVDGKDVYTTIDIGIQDIAHHALLKQLKKYNADHGSVVVMEVSTGKIKAIANLGRAKDGGYYEKLNYAVGESQEPGSTFKVASIMAALEDGYVDITDVFDTEKGTIYIHGKKVKDSKRGGYGKINVARILEVSSNVGTVKIIRKYYDNKPDKFIERMKSFGLGEKLGLPIKGEGVPIIPSPEEESWSRISLEWMSWGYGVSFTPLQILAFYNAIANDGVFVKPQFIDKIVLNNKEEETYKTIVLKEKIASIETINKIKKILENVVKKGSASKLYNPLYSMAGKTGTCQKSYWKKGGLSYISSFAGFFPVDNPKYSCITVIHEPKKNIGYYGADVAGPVFKEVAEKIYVSTPTEYLIENMEESMAKIDENYNYFDKDVLTKIPKVTGMPVMDAVALLENMGLNVEFEGLGKVRRQSIRKGSAFRKGQTIKLTVI
ncbi:MAG: transpeptidase family protein [Flavobacteriaceae bacterium]|nr:transpeptidase family protein [Flavobacteriaceae bacterium]